MQLAITFQVKLASSKSHGTGDRMGYLFHAEICGIFKAVESGKQFNDLQVYGF